MKTKLITFFFVRNSASQYGLTLVEAVIAVALFSGIAMGLFSTFIKISSVMRLSQEKVVATALANEQFEIVRNLPFAKVGTVGGIPSGLIAPVQTIVRGGLTFIATTTVRNIDQPFDGTAGGIPDDLSPADNKLVEIEITCISCSSYRPIVMTTTVGPKDLEGASTNGSLFVRVFDSGGQPVPGANVHIYNPTLSPAVNITDVTNTSGMLQVVDAPPSVTAYQIAVSKAGYSSERTHGTPTTTNPVKPHATVAVQTVTQLTFLIDRNATLDISSVSPSCVPVPNIGVQLAGAKLIGTLPDEYKYVDWFSTGASAEVTKNDIEWDTYTLTASSALYDLGGVSILSPFSVLPGATQNIQAVMVPKDSPSVMVTVRDGGTGLPVTGASVKMDLGGASTSQTTGRGFLTQTDWSLGDGQEAYSDPARYASSDLGVDTSINPGSVELKDVLGAYSATGVLESSTFDTGSASNFYQFTSLPLGQPLETGPSPLLFQLATGNSTSSWTYLGPDGTASSFYSATSTDISPVHNGDRYLRYKAYLSTASSTLTPVLSDVMFTFTSACVPPGQVLFQDLSNGDYDLTVTAPGYADFTSTVTVDAGTPWQEVTAVLVP